MKKKFLKLSLWSFIAGAFVFVFNYFFYHFVTDDGITTVWQAEAGKPFVAELIGNLGVLFIYAAAMCLLVALIFFNKNERK